MKDREIRVGVIGVGKIGSHHIRNLAQRISNAHVVAVMMLIKLMLMLSLQNVTAVNPLILQIPLSPTRMLTR